MAKEKKAKLTSYMKWLPMCQRIFESLTEEQINGLLACLNMVGKGELNVDDVIRACVKLRKTSKGGDK